MYSYQRIIYGNIDWTIVPNQKGWQYTVTMGERLLNKNKYHCSAGLDSKLKQMTE